MFCLNFHPIQNTFLPSSWIFLIHGLFGNMLFNFKIIWRFKKIQFYMVTFNSLIDIIYGINFTHLTCKIKCLGHIHRVVRSSTQSNFRAFLSLPKETLYPLAVTPQPSPAPAYLPSLGQLQIYFLSLWICLFWTFHKWNDIIPSLL